MTKLQTISPLQTDALTETFRQLQGRVTELGLNLSIWNVQRRCTGRLCLNCEFCRTIHNASRSSLSKASREVVERVIATAEPVITSNEVGCSLIGLPIRHRRKLSGVMIACWPTIEMLDEERLARMCDRIHLDHGVMTNLAEEACRYHENYAGTMVNVLGWLIKDQQNLSTASGELSTLSTNLANTYEELSLVYCISGSMRVTQNPREFLQNACDELLEVMNLSAVAVVVHPRESDKRNELVVTAGQIDLDDTQLKLLVAQRLAKNPEANANPQVNNNFAQSSAAFEAFDESFTANIENLITVPLVCEEGNIGMLMGINKLSGDFDSVDLKLVSSIGSQAAAFLTNSRLYDDLRDLMMGVLHALTASIDAKDPYTCGHSRRVAQLSKILAEACGLGQDKVQRIYMSGLLHDVGKIGVSEAILRKPGRLTDEEFRLIMRHPAKGAEIMSGIKQLEDIVAGILTHHEHPDGHGYPNALSGTQIPLEGLIVGLADSFDAMTSGRTYRKALSIEEVIEEIKINSGTQFDPDLVETFLKMDLEVLLKELYEPANNKVADCFSGDTPRWK